MSGETGEVLVQGGCIHGTAVLGAQLAGGQLGTCSSLVSGPGHGLAGCEPMGGYYGWAPAATRMAAAALPVAHQCILCDIRVCLVGLRALLGVAMVEPAWSATDRVVTMCEHLLCTLLSFRTSLKPDLVRLFSPCHLQPYHGLVLQLW